MTSLSRPLALTMGDPAGIGLDVTLLAWQRRRRQRFIFLAIADPRSLADRARALGLHIPLAEVSHPDQAASVFDDALPVLPLSAAAGLVTAGRPEPGAAPLVVESIERAVDLAIAGEIAGIITNPIAKNVLYQSGFRHPGHTEFLEALARARGLEAQAVMMLAAPGLRTVPLTIHCPLKEVPAALSETLIIEQTLIVARDLSRFFGLDRPRIVVAGLNPHAGEEGTIGTEERDIIIPAIAALRARGLDITGPLPADTMFHEEARAGYDVAICMYHDQALIPVKLLDFHEGVNCTLGLPFIRTSPDHGTAFSLAGTGSANPSSLLASIEMAAAMAAAMATS